MSTIKNLLFLRFLLFNVLCIAALISSYVFGYVDMAIEADSSRMIFVIFGLLVISLFLSGHRAWQLDRLMRTKVWRSGFDTIQIRLFSRIAVIKHIGSMLVLLGLIGTVIGFIIALSGIDPNAASDVKEVPMLVSQMIDGMGVALYTTLVGAICYVWAMSNHQILHRGAAQVLARRLDV